MMVLNDTSIHIVACSFRVRPLEHLARPRAGNCSVLIASSKALEKSAAVTTDLNNAAWLGAELVAVVESNLFTSPSNSDFIHTRRPGRLRIGGTG